MPNKPLTLPGAVKRLRQHHGTPPPLPTDDPFELILLENVAYLASPERRREAFLRLKETVGTNPSAILAARTPVLERITAKGILKDQFAAKLRECARIVIEQFNADLGPTIAGPLKQALRALRTFPGIGEPGAEKILLFAGRHPSLAPESNGLRVLVRLGLIQEEKSYAKTYAAGRRVAEPLKADCAVLQEAHLLLQKHGRTLCRRNAPRCETCPLANGCAHARRERERS